LRTPGSQNGQYCYMYTHCWAALVDGFPRGRILGKVGYATIDEAVFYVDPTDDRIDWLDSDHVICVYSRSMSFLRGRILVKQSVARLRNNR
jgi:hypothetical protein